MHRERRVVMMNREDMDELGLSPRQLVDVTSHFNGQTRVARGFIAVGYPIARRCAAMYYPEANVLVPIGSTEPLSNCPTYKHVIISLRPSRGRSRRANRDRRLSGESSAVQQLDNLRDRFPYSPAFRSSARGSMGGCIRSDEASL